jgi:hypothetical protein
VSSQWPATAAHAAQASPVAAKVASGPVPALASSPPATAPASAQHARRYCEQRDAEWSVGQPGLRLDGRNASHPHRQHNPVHNEVRCRRRPGRDGWPRRPGGPLRQPAHMLFPGAGRTPEAWTSVRDGVISLGMVAALRCCVRVLAGAVPQPR